MIEDLRLLKVFLRMQVLTLMNSTMILWMKSTSSKTKNDQLIAENKESKEKIEDVKKTLNYMAR